MPVDLRTFDASLKKSGITPVCRELELTQSQCQKLGTMIPTICKIKPSTKTKRKRSLWQQCIAERRKGKKFDPQAIKELAKLYREGKCP